MQPRILLVNTDTCPIAKVYPIGLDYVTSVLRSHGYSVDTLDLAFIGQSEWEHAFESVYASHAPYLAVGVGIRNLYDELYGGRNYLPEIIRFVKYIRRQISTSPHRTPVILGGSGFSLMPETILEYTDAEYGIINEGEQAVLTLLDRLRVRDYPDAKIHSQAFDVGSATYTRGAWGNFHGYFRDGASGNIQTKRGCPLGCLYCEYPAIEGKTFRFRDPSCVAQEYLALEAWGFPRVYFVDATFNNPRDQAKLILQALKKAKTRVPWTAFFNPRLLDEELLVLTKETGGANPLKLTIESGSDVMLQALHKSFRREHIRDAVELCRKHAVDFTFTLLFGGPGETKETVEETCRLVRECRPVSMSMNIGIFLHPKTPIAQLSKGTLWKSESDFLSPIVYPCDRGMILRQIHASLSGSGIEYRVYGGGEN